MRASSDSGSMVTKLATVINNKFEGNQIMKKKTLKHSIVIKIKSSAQHMKKWLSEFMDYRERIIV